MTNSLLRQITAQLLDPKDNYGELFQAVNNMYEMFIKASGMEADSSSGNSSDIYLQNGKAIGTAWAALCVKEIMRTKRFVQGMYEGIKAAKEKFKGTPIHIVYAGTGPFATLAVPMTTLFTSKEINFTFLEINKESIRLLENVIKAFQIDDYVNEIVQCDATAYKYDKDKPIHMVVSETMQNALQKEPQVAITMNLAKQMDRDGIFIPQNIAVEAVLLHPGRSMERMMSQDVYKEKYYHSLSTVFEVNKDIINTYDIPDMPCEKFIFPEKVVDIPQDIEAGFDDLCLFTRIYVFGDIYLDYWSCSLTMPKKLEAIGREKSIPQKAVFRYEVSEKPGFQYSLKA